MNSSRKPLRLSFNAPATLAFAGLCLLVRLIDMLTGGEAVRLLFSVYRTSLSDPLAYVRCFTHVLGHAGWDHLLGNMMYILILGPMIEEKYGTANTVPAMIASVTTRLNRAFVPCFILSSENSVL